MAKLPRFWRTVQPVEPNVNLQAQRNYADEYGPYRSGLLFWHTLGGPPPNDPLRRAQVLAWNRRHAWRAAILRTVLKPSRFGGATTNRRALPPPWLRRAGLFGSTSRALPRRGSVARPTEDWPVWSTSRRFKRLRGSQSGSRSGSQSGSITINNSSSSSNNNSNHNSK